MSALFHLFRISPFERDQPIQSESLYSVKFFKGLGDEFLDLVTLVVFEVRYDDCKTVRVCLRNRLH